MRHLLSRLAALVDVVNETRYFIDHRVSFDDLTSYVESQSGHPLKNGAGASDRGTNSEGLRNPAKLPTLKVPVYSGEASESVDYLDNVQEVFASHGVEQFLTDREHCNSHLEWSSAFSARLRDSLSKSSVLDFIAQKQKKQRLTALV